MSPELKRLFKTIELSNLDEQDFLKSDYCGECGGVGFIEERHQAPYGSEKFQCESCEELHKAEIRADRMHDLAKGN